MRHYIDRVHTPIDFVKWTLPLHFGGTYAYLSNSLVIGFAITFAFAILYIIQE